MAMGAPKTDTAISCARTKELAYVVYFNSRRKEDAAAHLKLAYKMNADDANVAHQVYFRGRSVMTPSMHSVQRKPAGNELRARSDLGAQRGQPTVVPLKKTMFDRNRGPVLVKETNKTPRRYELSIPVGAAKRQALNAPGVLKN